MHKLLFLSVGLFLISWALPALEFRRSNAANDVMFGLRALVVGWSGVFAAVFAWFANPFWFFGVVFLALRKPWLAGFLGVIAIAFAATTFSVLGRELPGDEGNVTKTAVIKLLPGCYVWMASLVLLPIAAVLSRGE